MRCIIGPRGRQDRSSAHCFQPVAKRAEIPIQLVEARVLCSEVKSQFHPLPKRIHIK